MSEPVPAAEPAPETETTGDPPSPVDRFGAGLRALGVTRLATLGLAAALILGLIGYLVLRVAEGEYTLLYANLELEDGAAIVSRLEAMDVPHRLRSDGTAILVPADEALRLRMLLAEEGLPAGGSVGYEIFDETSAFGTTSFISNLNHRRALEGELGRTIGSIAGVRSARVHLVLPERELFRRDRIEPSASITLNMVGGRRLSPRQVQAVRNLVAAAVPDLLAERVTLVDDQGTLLARGGDADRTTVATQAEEFRRSLENRLRTTIEELLARTLGPGRVRAEVRAELDFDQITTTEETYDPEGRVVRSTQTVEEESELAEQDRNEAVGVGNNLPDANAAPDAGRTANENTTRTEETVNYEVSRRIRNHTQAGGRIERLSVAVLVDGKMVAGPDGEPVYQELTEAELDRIRALVTSAVGVDTERGDVVEVVNLPFSAPDLPDSVDSWFTLTKHDLFRLGEIGTLAVVALILILTVLRPAVRQALPAPQHALAAPEGAVLGSGGTPGMAALGDGGEAQRLTGPAGDDGDGDEEAFASDDELIDINQVDSVIKAGLINRVTEAIDKSPDDAVSVIRAWMHES